MKNFIHFHLTITITLFFLAGCGDSTTQSLTGSQATDLSSSVQKIYFNDMTTGIGENDPIQEIIVTAMEDGWDGFAIISSPGKPDEIIYFKNDETNGTVEHESYVFYSFSSSLPAEDIEDIESYLSDRLDELMKMELETESSE